MHVHPKLGEEMMWAAMRAGNIDAAYEIRDAGDAVKIGWMESAPAILSTSRAATRRISGVATHDSSAFDYGGTVPPAAAMVLLSALGGTWVTPLPANTIKVSSSTNSGSITTSSKTSLDLGAILIAAEMSRSGAKFDAGHCETVAETLSNDSSFVETFVSRPHMIRQIMNVDDNNWTAFLAGKLGEVKGKEDEEVPMTLSWMEPAQLAGGKTLSGSGSMSSTEWQAPSRSDLEMILMKTTQSCYRCFWAWAEVFLKERFPKVGKPNLFSA
ncbi:hypothetical protein BC829DRAFT_449144 [Chytridium lagenaria]|nr:hypothetical protein BC829DRAFT_449144 [Chytridium lagenaria]